MRLCLLLNLVKIAEGIRMNFQFVTRVDCGLEQHIGHFLFHGTASKALAGS